VSAMSARAYRFASTPHWQQCVLHRLDVSADGTLSAIPRLGLQARRLARGDLSRVVVDWHGILSWCIARTHGSGVALQRFDPWERPAPPLELPRLLARSTRWIGDRRALWAFAPQGTEVGRFDAETLEADLKIDVAMFEDVAGVPFTQAARIVDIAGDGREGLWLLVQAVRGGQGLLHLDCEGCAVAAWPVPCGVPSSSRVGSVDRGRVLVLLSEDGRSLTMVDAASAAVIRVLRLGELAPCWAATRLATDGRRRIGLWGEGGPAVRRLPSLVLLDGTGDVLDGPLEQLFGPADAHASSKPLPHVRDLALDGGAVWFATDSGLWRVDSSDAAGRREGECSLLTPVLDSPPSDSSRGWLRAELDIDLPEGATLEARFGSTNDPDVADRVRQLLGDKSLTSGQRNESVWERFPDESRPPTAYSGAGAPGVALAAPLFASQDRWLWLGIRIVTPPGAAAPTLRELRVRYPDRSIAEHLPSIFLGDEHDPGAFLRRLVGVLETTTQDLDERIGRIGAQIDPATAPADRLDSLARWLAIPWDDGLPPPVKRALLRNAGILTAQRGTRDGLRLLMQCLLEGRGRVTVVDVTVDHPPARLGGPGSPGPALPMLLAGASPRAATLGAKAVLGRARLRCGANDCDPLRELVPTVRLELGAGAAQRRALEPVLDGLLAQYLPAGVHSVVRWSVVHGSATLDVGEGMVLDANGPARLGEDSLLGRTVLAGRSFGVIDEDGLDIGFRLQ
jgi:phage tail-like protein